MDLDLNAHFPEIQYDSDRNENNKRSASMSEIPSLSNLSIASTPTPSLSPSPSPTPSPSPISPGSGSGLGLTRSIQRPRLQLRQSHSTPLPTTPVAVSVDALQMQMQNQNSAPSVELVTFCQRLSVLGHPHYTTIEPFRNPELIGSNALGSDPIPMDQVVGMDAVFAMLREHIQKPLAFPGVVHCANPILFLEGPSGVGFQTAVRAFCNSPQEGGAFKLNLLTYRFFSNSELMQGSTFFAMLLQLACFLTPCVLLIHRPYGRLGNNREFAATPLKMLAEAYIPYAEIKPASGFPLFWIVFADDVDASPGSIWPRWEIIDRTKRCYVNSMTMDQKLQYLQRRVGARLVRILEVPASAGDMPPDLTALLEQYTQEMGRVMAANRQVFETGGIRDLNNYVDYLFSMPAKRLTVDQLYNLRTNAAASPDDSHLILPSIEQDDFDQAIMGITAAHCQANERLAARAAADLQQQQHITQRLAQHFN